MDFPTDIKHVIWLKAEICIVILYKLCMQPYDICIMLHSLLQSRIILCMSSANERRRYNTTSLTVAEPIPSKIPNNAIKLSGNQYGEC